MARVLERKRNTMLATLAAVAVLSFVALSAIGENYPLFHTLIELMVAVVALSVFMVAWHTRTIATSDYLTFIGLASLSVGAVTVMHALAYKGMPVFPGYSTNLPTQLWVIAKTLQATAFLIAPLFLIRRLRHPAVPLCVYCSFAVIAVGAAFAGFFPTAFVEGQGLTPFKVNMEYLIIGMTAAGAVGLYWYRDKMVPDVALLLWASMAATIVAELAFTLYSDPFGSANRIGHAAHFAAYLLIYAALIQTSLERPLDTLFREIKARETDLADAYAIEHEIAETLQDAMVLQPERVPGLILAHRYLPSPGAGRIGGDFYDVFVIKDGLVGFVIGDVCGKGLKAAMTTMKARSALRAVTFDDSDPTRVLEAVNGYLRRELSLDSFVTAIFGTIRTQDGQVRLAVAGHPEPIICGRPGDEFPSEFRAPPLGVMEHLAAKTWEFNLVDGQTLVLVTDGVLEAGPVSRQFGSERLSALLHSVKCGGTPNDTVDAILRALEDHTGSTLNDDVAIVALQRRH